MAVYNHTKNLFKKRFQGIKFSVSRFSNLPNLSDFSAFLQESYVERFAFAFLKI